jgi:AraC-like DNA-binding protein
MTSPPNQLVISTRSALSASNAGLFVAPRCGLHPERELASFELIFVRSGVLRLWENLDKFQISPGQTLILWPGRRHGPSAPYEPKTSFYWLHFELDSARSDPGVVVNQVAEVPRPLRLVELFRRFLDDQENNDLEPNYAATLIKLMLLEIAHQDESKQAKRLQPPARKLAATAQVAIGKRFREPITTSEIARTLHCNPDYLGRVYRETFGHSLTTGIHQARMHHAKNLLLLSSLNVKEISASCGYSNPDYFRRMFRRFFDMQPNQFRSLHPRQHTNAA